MHLLKKITLLLFAFIAINANAQVADTLRVSDFVNADSLQNVTVSAFASQGKWKDVAAPVAIITRQDLQVLNQTSLVPVMNTVPGVRMEERSPGSYRFSIRGSLLRSPFGVRNIKIYWNDIPLTDAGGNTYLQVIDPSQINSAEIIKGPASSLYGANTGGALILHTLANADAVKNHLNVALSGGSFGLFNQQLGWNYNSKNFTSNLQQSHQQSDGYRQQSAMHRNAVKWDGNWQINAKEKLSYLAFYSDLYYQTPGGITQHQMDSMPSLARPQSITQKAYVRNKTLFAGLSLTSDIAAHFQNITTVTANHADFKNLAVLNYEARNEWNYGGRTTFIYNLQHERYNLKWLIGAEVLQGHYKVGNDVNNAGTIGDVLFRDNIYANQSFVFSQVQLQLNNKFNMQAGVSYNNQDYRYKRLTDVNAKSYTKNNVGKLWAPRLSLLYRLNNDVSVYGVAAKGFSTPTLAEVRPSNGNYYGDLVPEYGWNYELGFKGTALQNRLLFDASFYYFNLHNAIVRRNDSTGAEYFVNAGGTTQKGIELFAQAYIIKNAERFVTSLSLSNSYSYQPYRFNSYVSGANDYSNNKLTGVPRNINVSTLQLHTKPGVFANVIFNYTSKLPVNDANTAYADDYHLLQFKFGYEGKLSTIHYNVYVGADNLLNEVYSLGNDINAAGNRYFNPAPKRNCFAGINVSF